MQLLENKSELLLKVKQKNICSSFISCLEPSKVYDLFEVAFKFDHVFSNESNCP